MSILEIILTAFFTLGLVFMLFKLGSSLLNIFDTIAKNNTKKL